MIIMMVYCFVCRVPYQDTQLGPYHIKKGTLISANSLVSCCTCLDMNIMPRYMDDVDCESLHLLFELHSVPDVQQQL